MPIIWRRLVVFVVSLMPLGWVIYKAFNNELGADPQKAIVLFMGKWAFYFLIITLSVTPLKKIAQQGWLMQHRRMLGLFTLFYALLHVISYYVLILQFDLSSLGFELVKRPYILVTIPAVFLLIALGATSTKSIMRRLGKNWVKLHKGIYVVALLGWIHVLMQVRSSYANAVLFGILVAALLGIRFYWNLRKSFLASKT